MTTSLAWISFATWVLMPLLAAITTCEAPLNLRSCESIRPISFLVSFFQENDKSAYACVCVPVGPAPRMRTWAPGGA